MLRQSLENSQATDGDNDTSGILRPDLTDFNSVFARNRQVDKSLVLGTDNSLSFGTKDLYRSDTQNMHTNEFDKLNTDKAKNPTADVLSKSEITQGAYEILVASNTNGNGIVDKDEWMKVSPLFGFNKEDAEQVYTKGVEEARSGVSLKQIAEDLLTPKIMMADKNKSDDIDRAEFDLLITQIVDGSLPDNGTDRPSVTTIAENQALHDHVSAIGSVTSTDMAKIYDQLDRLPQSAKQALLDNHIRIDLYGKASEDLSSASGVHGYTDGHTISIHMDSGMESEAFQHEVFHIIDMNAPSGGLVTWDTTYQNLLREDIDKLTPSQYLSIHE